jgi:hypothetical protein
MRAVSTPNLWSPGQRALLRFLEREGLLGALPDPPAGEGTPHDDALFALIAESVPAPVVAEMLALRLRLPLLQAEDELDAAAATLLAGTVATRCWAIPIALQGEQLEVAVANPLDLETVKMIEFASGRRVRVRVATPETVRGQIARLYGQAEAAAPAEAPAAPAETVPASPAPEPLRPDPAPPAEPPAAAPEAPAPACEAAGAEVPGPRQECVLLLLGDAIERERLARTLRDRVPEWIVMTAADPAEAAVTAHLTLPDVAVVDVGTDPAALAGGTLARLPRLVVAGGADAGDLLVRARTLIDTARRG